MEEVLRAGRWELVGQIARGLAGATTFDPTKRPARAGLLGAARVRLAHAVPDLVAIVRDHPMSASPA